METMNSKIYMTIALGVLSVSAWAQSDRNDRLVTVEHEFQPTVQQATMIKSTPEALPEQTVEEKPLVWSDYVGSMEAGKNVPSLKSEPTAIKGASDETHGEMKGGIGHPQTLFDFRYGFGQKQNSVVLDVNHHAYWGEKMHEKTGLGFRFKHDYRTGDFLLRAAGDNECFTYYGRQIESGREEKQNIWRFQVDMGAQSNEKQNFQYLVRAEYRLFSRVNSVLEHQVNLQLNMAYKWDYNNVGINLRSQNQFCLASDSIQQLFDAQGKTSNSRHALRMEPYYEWHNKRLRLHVGMNFDMNIGKGEMMSAHTDDLARQVAFAPSPNVRIEADLMPKTVVLYGQFEGSLGYSSMPGYLALNPYMNSGWSVTSHHVSTYKPIIGEVGFRFRPIGTLLISLHGGYEYVRNGSTFMMGASDFLGRDFGVDYARYYYTDYQRWKFGGQVDYHYRDIIDLHVWGDYYMYRGVKTFLNGAGDDDPGTETEIFDRPNFELGAKIEGHIDNHWSVYTWDTFMGSRTGMVEDKTTAQGYVTKRLPVYVDINLGVKYHFADTGNKALDRLGLFFELKNIIHRKNVIWYGYESHGINGIVGLTWSF